MEGALKLLNEAGAGVDGRAKDNSDDARFKTVAAGARGFATSMRAAGDALLSTFANKVLLASEALRRRIKGLAVDCSTIAERGDAAMLELANDAMAPTLPYIIFKTQNAWKTVDSVATLTNKQKEFREPLAQLTEATQQVRVLLGFDHAVTVIFAEARKAKPADTPKMLETVKSKLASAGVLMDMPDVILEKLGVNRKRV